MTKSGYRSSHVQAQVIYKGVSDISKIAKGLIITGSAVVGGDGTAGYTIPIGKTMADVDYQCTAQISLDPDLLGLYIKNITNKAPTTFDIVLDGIMAADKSIVVDFRVMGLEA